MFALEVTEELEHWPEQKNRSRRWVSFMNKFLKNHTPLGEVHNSSFNLYFLTSHEA